MSAPICPICERTDFVDWTDVAQHLGVQHNWVSLRCVCGLSLYRETRSGVSKRDYYKELGEHLAEQEDVVLHVARYRIEKKEYVDGFRVASGAILSGMVGTIPVYGSGQIGGFQISSGAVQAGRFIRVSSFGYMAVTSGRILSGQIGYPSQGTP